VLWASRAVRRWANQWISVTFISQADFPSLLLGSAASAGTPTTPDEVPRPLPLSALLADLRYT
jgi:hypothetical protein